MLSCFGGLCLRFATFTFLAMSFPTATAIESSGLSGLMLLMDDDDRLCQCICSGGRCVFSGLLGYFFVPRLAVTDGSVVGLMEDDTLFLVRAFFPLKRSVLFAVSTLKGIQ